MLEMAMQGMTTAVRILAVIGDDRLKESLTRNLQLYPDFQLITEVRGGEAIEAVRDELFDIILIEAELPDINGREVCRIMRRQGVTAPIIMLTDSEADADVILSLDAGADDCEAKSVRFAVLLARIRAHLREHEHADTATFSIGPFVFRPGYKILVDKETSDHVHVTEKEAAILKSLLRSPNKWVEREALVNEVWGNNVTVHRLESTIYRLRRKLERDPSHPEILLTEFRGYRLAH